MGFVDLHSHVLFGLDDGAKDANEACAMLDALAALGVTEQCVTPHQKASQFLPTASAISQALAATTALRKPNHPQLRLGAENMWDDVFFGRLQSETIPCYAQSSAMLIEFPLAGIPVGAQAALFKLRLAGKLPVLAHPERYDALADETLARAFAAQCAFVLDLPALAGFHGRREAKAARRFVDLGLFHAVATDAHSVVDVERASEGLDWLRKHGPRDVVKRAFSTAPQQILAGEFPELVT